MSAQRTPWNELTADLGEPRTDASQSKTLLLSLIVAIAGACIVVVATSGLVESPNERMIPPSSQEPALPAPPSTASPEPDAPPTPSATRGPAAAAPAAGSPTEPEVAVAASPTFRPSPPRTSLIAPTPTPPAPADLVDRTGEFRPFPVSVGIRQVDFANGFTYPVAHYGPVRVTAGAGVSEVWPENDSSAELIVGAISYGDVTGDGVEDAVVAVETRENSYTSHAVWVFAITDGLLDRWSVQAPWEYTGPIRDLTIVRDGLVEATSWNGYDGSSTSTRTLSTTGRDEFLETVAETTAVGWFDLAQSAEEPVVLWPVVDGIHAELAVKNGVTSQVVAFETDKPTLAVASLSQGDGAFVRITDRETGHAIGDIFPGRELALPGPGSYLGWVLFGEGASADAVVDLHIADRNTLRLPGWSARAFTSTEGGGAAAQSVKIFWPEFASADGHPLDAANRLVADFIARRQGAHEEAIVDCDDAQNTLQRIDFSLAALAPDLVSIEFSEYGYRCGQSAGGMQTHVLTIDLRTGRLVGAGEVVDLASPTLPSLWWESASQAGYVHVDDLTSTEFQGFDAVVLRADGVRLESMVETTNGPVQLSGFLTFDQLGPFVDPALAARAEAGIAMSSAYETCGC